MDRRREFDGSTFSLDAVSTAVNIDANDQIEAERMHRELSQLTPAQLESREQERIRRLSFLERPLEIESPAIR